MEGYIKNSNKYSHLSSEERGKIEAYLHQGVSISRIAIYLKRSKSTISEELRRGRYNGRYTAEISHKRALRNRKESHKHTKWRNIKMLHFIDNCLKKRWSPQIISHELMQKHGIHFSHTSIYSLIKNHRPEWKKYLILRGKRRCKRSKDAYKGRIQDRLELSLRPQEANERTRVGDIEVDTVVSSKGGKSCLFVAVDRRTRYYMIEKMASKNAEEMQKAILKISENFRIKTITYDNGSENALHSKTNELIGCKSFFCRPYCSQDKGSVENRNKILRQFLKKGTNFDLISEEEIRKIQDMINNRPMKSLGWSSPAQLISSFGLLL